MLNGTKTAKNQFVISVFGILSGKGSKLYFSVRRIGFVLQLPVENASNESFRRERQVPNKTFRNI